MDNPAIEETRNSFRAAIRRVRPKLATLVDKMPARASVGAVGVGMGDEQEEESEPFLSAPEFPLDVLPKVVQEFIREAAASLPVPIDLIAAPVLACLGAAIGAHRAIQPKPNWTTRPALYVACIADPGSLKTPALTLAASPVFRQQDQYEQTYHEAMTRYEESQALHTRALDAHRKGKTDTLPPKPVQPILQRTWTADETTERLAGILRENPRGVVIVRDELSAWIKSFNQYKGGKGADKQFYLSAWSGEPLAVDRQGKEPVLVPHPFLSVVGCIPPDVLPDLDEDNREDGFLHRLLFVHPDPVPVRWTEMVLSDPVKQAYADLLGQLYALQPHPDGSPIVLGLSAPAKTLFVEWHDTHCAEQENPALPSLVQGAYAKLKGYAPRFALIHALASNPHAQHIEAESIGAAEDLVEYFKIQVQRVAPLLARHARTPEACCEHSIRRALARGKRLTKRDIQRAGNTPADLFNHIWAALLTKGALIPGTDETQRKVFQLRGSIQGAGT